jgi:hypothetical protein
MLRAFPAIVRGPVDSPPCNRHRPFRERSATSSQTDGASQGLPLRVRAPHLGRSALAALIAPSHVEPHVARARAPARVPIPSSVTKTGLTGVHEVGG